MSVQTEIIRINNEVTGQADLMAQIKTALVEKTSVGKLQGKTVTPSTEQQTVLPDTGYDGLKQVVIEGDSDLVADNIKSGVSIFGVTGSYEGSGGGSAETCTISLVIDAPNRDDFTVHHLNNNFVLATTTLDAMMGGTFTVAKDTIIAITPWMSSGSATGGCTRLFGDMSGGAFIVSGDGTLLYA